MHVVITGGARGIGLATAKAFAANGARVAIGDIDDELPTQQAEAIGVFGHRVDVTDKSSFAKLLEAAEDALGPVDVPVNNAGIMPLGPLPEEPDEVASRIVSINLLGVINGTKLAMDRMVPRRTGHIVNVSSAVGRVAVPHAATYSATKFAVVGLTEAVRGELRGTGVQASVILPAIVNTDLGSGLNGGELPPPFSQKTLPPPSFALSAGPGSKPGYHRAITSAIELCPCCPEERSRRWAGCQARPTFWRTPTTRHAPTTRIEHVSNLRRDPKSHTWALAMAKPHRDQVGANQCLASK
jgi:NAD(P)-dependent dehydrogenase (short-subunit alcohol dehydrogenase family)